MVASRPELPESALVLGKTPVIAGLLVSLLGLTAAAACGSHDNRRRVPRAGAAGEAGQESNSGGESSLGGQPSSGGGEGGNAGALAGSAGGAPAVGSAGAPAAGGVSDTEVGSGGAGGAVAGVGTYGCFIHSGDGGDMLESGALAVSLTSSVYSAACDSAWISENPDAFAPEQTPTTLVIRRTFVLDSSLGAGQFSITFQADDAVEFVLNGQSVATCSPPPENLGLCQQGCTSVPIPAGTLKGAGELNTLEARLTNLQSAPVGNNWGYTALNYSVCVAAE